MKTPEFYTIGVYGKTEDQFFDTLLENSIDTFIDIRQRRAVRGSIYSFVNSKRLQKKLEQLGIKYLHNISLAPTKEIRQLQKTADIETGVKKRERGNLSQLFVEAYSDKILKDFNVESFVSHLKLSQVNKAVLFCVEKEPSSCHRSLVADKISNVLNISVHNL